MVSGENLADYVDGGRGASHLRGPPLAPWTGCGKRSVMTTELRVGRGLDEREHVSVRGLRRVSPRMLAQSGEGGDDGCLLPSRIHPASHGARGRDHASPVV